MATLKRSNPFSKVNNDTGFGTNASDYGGRFINRDGSFNLRKEGLPFWKRFSVYHTMLNLPSWKFIALIIVFFFGINTAYTAVYLMIGPGEFTGMVGTTSWQKVKELFFFSTETFTTVGYGRVNPIGDGANMVAAIEAMNGFLSFAVATGLIYGRFSRPTAYILFSKHALIAPYRGKTALMFRFVAYKDRHILSDVDIKVNTGLLIEENGKPAYRFFDLSLERSRVDSLPMNWTVVHPIDENSPFAGLSQEDLKTADVELYVLVRGFDDVFSTTVLQRTSYVFDEIIFNRKFTPMYRESSDGKTTIVELHKLHEHVEVVN